MIDVVEVYTAIVSVLANKEQADAKEVDMNCVLYI